MFQFRSGASPPPACGLPSSGCDSGGYIPLRRPPPLRRPSHPRAGRTPAPSAVSLPPAGTSPARHLLHRLFRGLMPPMAPIVTAPYQHGHRDCTLACEATSSFLCSSGRGVLACPLEGEDSARGRRLRRRPERVTQAERRQAAKTAGFLPTHRLAVSATFLCSWASS